MIKPDDLTEMGVAITFATFVGECLRCGEPSCSEEFNIDEDDSINMRCVSCGYKTHLELKRDDNDFYFPITNEG